MTVEAAVTPEPTAGPEITVAPTIVADAPIPTPPFDDADVAVLLAGLLKRTDTDRTGAIV